MFVAHRRVQHMQQAVAKTIKRKAAIGKQNRKATVCRADCNRLQNEHIDDGRRAPTRDSYCNTHSPNFSKKHMSLQQKRPQTKITIILLNLTAESRTRWGPQNLKLLPQLLSPASRHPRIDNRLPEDYRSGSKSGVVPCWRELETFACEGQQFAMTNSEKELVRKRRPSSTFSSGDLVCSMVYKLLSRLTKCLL